MIYRRQQIIRILIVFISSVFLYSCSLTRELTPGKKLSDNSSQTLHSICDSLPDYTSLYINRIKADFYLEEEKYDARLSIYYIPDSLIFISAVNSGFEIVRVAITKDSVVSINRIDKIAYVYKESQQTYSAPVDFSDLELLINRKAICKFGAYTRNMEDLLVLDKTVSDIKKEIKYTGNDLKIIEFEFFQKKTGEYFIGERLDETGFSFYSNFIFDNIKVVSKGGNIEYNRVLDLNWDINLKKYKLITL